MTMDWSKIKLTQESLLNAMRLPEYQSTIATMSYRQLHTELSTLESLKTQVMKKQEADEANNRELHAALKKEGEELEDQRRKKRQFNRLKETLEAPTQHGRIATSPSLETIEALESSFPDLETLASLNQKKPTCSPCQNPGRDLHSMAKVDCSAPQNPGRDRSIPQNGQSRLQCKGNCITCPGSGDGSGPGKAQAAKARECQLRSCYLRGSGSKGLACLCQLRSCYHSE